MSSFPHIESPFNSSSPHPPSLDPSNLKVVPGLLMVQYSLVAKEMFQGNNEVTSSNIELFASVSVQSSVSILKHRKFCKNVLNYCWVEGLLLTVQDKQNFSK